MGWVWTTARHDSWMIILRRCAIWCVVCVGLCGLKRERFRTRYSLDVCVCREGRGWGDRGIRENLGWISSMHVVMIEGRYIMLQISMEKWGGGSVTLIIVGAIRMIRNRQMRGLQLDTSQGYKVISTTLFPFSLVLNASYRSVSRTSSFLCHYSVISFQTIPKSRQISQWPTNDVRQRYGVPNISSSMVCSRTRALLSEIRRSQKKSGESTHTNLFAKTSGAPLDVWII